MDITKGSIQSHSDFGFYSQVPWIFNGKSMWDLSIAVRVSWTIFGMPLQWNLVLPWKLEKSNPNKIGIFCIICGTQLIESLLNAQHHSSIHTVKSLFTVSQFRYQGFSTSPKYRDHVCIKAIHDSIYRAPLLLCIFATPSPLPATHGN
jgi:hypothetical protein